MSIKSIERLAKKALKDNFKTKPAPGLIYLKDLPIGKMFETPGGTRGVLIECEINAKVVILDVKVPEEDRQYYLGKHIISGETEVYNGNK
jgi:hypothetical protein